LVQVDVGSEVVATGRSEPPFDELYASLAPSAWNKVEIGVRAAEGQALFELPLAMLAQRNDRSSIERQGTEARGT